ncbi:hypothetical protein BH11PLA1_BH11PLA1_03310 [soil metagenome]
MSGIAGSAPNQERQGANDEFAGVVVIVLAAGAGARMGGPKALMKVAKRAWWMRQQLALKTEVGIDALWVVTPLLRSRIERAARLFRRSTRELVVPRMAAVEEPRAGAEPQPMFASVLRGVRSVLNSGTIERGVFVLPVDTPVPRRAVWSGLVRADRPAVPGYDGTKGHPIFLPISWLERRIIPLLSDEPSAAMAMRLDALIGDNFQRVPVTDPRVAMNLNTPERRAEFERSLA